MKAQRETSCFVAQHRRAYILNDMGTGKTLATLWAYDYHRSIGTLHKMLVVAPMSTMERTWADEVFRHFPHLDVSVLYGTRARRQKLLEQDADVYVVNHDGLKIIASSLAERPDIDLVVVDELAQVARNKQTDRWKVLNEVINTQLHGDRWAWGLTGTPTPNAPTDAYAQCALIRPDSVPKFYGRFRDSVMLQIAPHKWKAKDHANDVVFQAMQPSIRFKRDECVDLPECMYQTLTVEMTDEQRKAYTEMLTKMRAEADAGEITAVNEAVKINKLLQISTGVVYTKDGQEVTIPATHRINALLEVIESAEAKVIVFVPFVPSVDYVAGAVAAQGLSVERIHGGVSKAERDRIFQSFQQSHDPRVLVAQPAAMSHGLTLTEANVVVWYGPVNSNDIYEQACARITRPGQKRRQLIVHIEGSLAEKRVYARLQGKQRLQGLLLDMIANDREST
jgi:SNF2 family DNA or RNA helicase